MAAAFSCSLLDERVWYPGVALTPFCSYWDPSVLKLLYVGLFIPMLLCSETQVLPEATAAAV